MKNPEEKFGEMSLDELADILSLTIKHDKENKLVTFLAMLSAYTDESQINVSFNAPSSSGKTYLASEIAKLFPAEDKIELSGASPTSFFYGESEVDEERKAKIVSLARKILIFYELPDAGLQRKLRSVLSHDNKELTFRMTNKGKKGENRAVQIIIQGFPASIFCSAGLRLDEQEATRAILLSPEVTEEKIHEGVHLQAVRGANLSEFRDAIESDERRKLLKERIVAIRDEMVDDIIVPDHEIIEERFKAMLGGLIKPRNMRDMGHIMRLIKSIALLNVWHRRKDGSVVANEADIDHAFKIWSYFMESLQLGISPALLKFYKRFVLEAYHEKRGGMGEAELEMLESAEPTGVGRQELALYYLKATGQPINEDYLRKEVLPQLESCGLIYQAQPSSGDKRSKHIYPQVFFDEIENNIGDGGAPPPEGVSEEEKRQILDDVEKLFPGI